MCLIIYSPDGHIPKQHLKRALLSNPDGWGYMFKSKDGMVVKRGLMAASFWKNWKADKKAAKGQNLLVHTRIATHGGKTMENTHPFRVGKRNLWMMHNGILLQHGDPHNLKSDTRMFIDEIVDKLPQKWLDDAVQRTLVEDYIGTSKLAFMDNKGDVALLNDVYGVWDGERWYSNESHLVPKMTALGYKSGTSYGYPYSYGWSDEEEIAAAAAHPSALQRSIEAELPDPDLDMESGIYDTPPQPITLPKELLPSITIPAKYRGFGLIAEKGGRLIK